jgi:hypothetical protein
LLNTVATQGNPNLTSERSKDLEAAYGHRFWSDTSINLVAYVSSVSNQLFSGTQPLNAASLANPNINGSLAGFATKINGACGTSYDQNSVIKVLGVSEVFNAQNALYRGFDVNGRLRVTRQAAFDYDYAVQSAQQFGEGAAILITNPYVLDGGQVLGVPLQKGSLSFDYSNAGFEGQIQGYYIGNNNTLNRPAYTYFTGFLSKNVSRTATLTLSAYNVFNQISQIYGYFGAQRVNSVNSYQTIYYDPVAAYVNYGGTGAEEFGIQPRTITFGLTLHF